jgi:hypothetical protein
MASKGVLPGALQQQVDEALDSTDKFNALDWLPEPAKLHETLLKQFEQDGELDKLTEQFQNTLDQSLTTLLSGLVSKIGFLFADSPGGLEVDSKAV